jgi:3-oxoacyl-[acyl-carrier-protein] synthase-3
VNVLIRATGSAVPDRIVSNADLERMVDTNDEWIVTRTGIRERRMMAPEEATSDIVTRAAQRALEQAKLTPADLDLIVVATCSPDTFTPATANYVQRNLCGGELTIPAFDINSACSGFVYGLEVATAMLQSAGYRRVLLAGGEGLTRFMDYQERSVSILFGDAAGAVILEKSDKPGGVLATTLRSDGQYCDYIQIPGGGARMPVSQKVLDERQAFVRMKGSATFKVAVQSMESVARDTLKKVGWSIEDVDHVIAHQANQRILSAVAERLEVPADKMPTNLEWRGNTSAASVPVLLDEQNRAGRFKAGDKVLLVAFGAGLTWGAAALEWTSTS